MMVISSIVSMPIGQLTRKTKLSNAYPYSFIVYSSDAQNDKMIRTPFILVVTSQAQRTYGYIYSQCAQTKEHRFSMAQTYTTWNRSSWINSLPRRILLAHYRLARGKSVAGEKCQHAAFSFSSFINFYPLHIS